MGAIKGAGRIAKIEIWGRNEALVGFVTGISVVIFIGALDPWNSVWNRHGF